MTDHPDRPDHATAAALADDARNILDAIPEDFIGTWQEAVEQARADRYAELRQKLDTWEPPLLSAYSADAADAAEPAEPTPAADSPLLSLLRGRLLAATAAAGTFGIAVSNLAARVAIVRADGSLSTAEAIDLLNQAGPLLAAAPDLLIAGLSLLALLATIASKAREIWRRRAG